VGGSFIGQNNGSGMQDRLSRTDKNGLRNSNAQPDSLLSPLTQAINLPGALPVITPAKANFEYLYKPATLIA
jgi:hypothetical protein